MQKAMDFSLRALVARCSYGGTRSGARIRLANNRPGFAIPAARPQILFEGALFADLDRESSAHSQCAPLTTIVRPTYSVQSPRRLTQGSDASQVCESAKTPNKFDEGEIESLGDDFNISEANFTSASLEVRKVGAVEAEMLGKICLRPAPFQPQIFESATKSNGDVIGHELILNCRV